MINQALCKILLTTSWAISYWIPLLSSVVKPTHEQLISLRVYLSFPFSSLSNKKSPVQIKGDEGDPSFVIMMSYDLLKKLMMSGNSSGLKYLYVAPEKRVAEKALPPFLGTL